MPVITGSPLTAGAVARLLIVPLLVLAASCGDVRGERLSPLLRELSDHAAARAVSGRLSVSSEHRACAETGAGPDSSAMPRCRIPAPPPDAELLTFASRVSSRVVEGAESEVLHAAGLIEMLWGGGEGNSLDQSISYLSGAARLSDEPAPALADLAAAYLARAEQGQYASDLLEALEAASRAVEAEPGNRAARFNLALILERLGLERGAREEWRNYLALDSGSGWAREAEERLGRIGSARRTIPTFPLTGTLAEAEAFAAEAPQDARFFGWDDALGAWGAAVLRRDSAEASRQLALAAMLGSALEARGGDATLADAVQAIRDASADSAAVLRLARGHRGLLAGRVAFREQRWEEARDSLANTLQGRPPSPMLDSWLRATYATTLLSLGQAAEAGRIFEDIAAGIDESRHPALEGQARWGLATMLVRQGDYDRSLQMADTAATLFARAGERWNAGFLLYLAADIQFASGARTAGYESMRQALSALRPFGETVPLNNLLAVSAAAVAADGLGFAAIRLQDEGVIVADSVGKLSSRGEAVLARAQLRAARGDTAGARRDLSVGAKLVNGIESRFVRGWLENERRITLAAISSRQQSGRTIAVLDSVIATPGGPGTEVRLLQALVARANARLELGQSAQALVDLDSATSLLAAQPGVLAGTPLRTSLLEAARGVFDRLVMLAANDGDATRSIEFMERGRVSFSSSGTALFEAGELDGPEYGAGLEYALIGDTLLIWVVADGDVVLSRSTVDRGALRRTIERARAALEFGETPAAAADLSRLYDWLVAPVRARLGEREASLVIVADGEISGAPFPALLDRGTGRYLIQDHPLRFAPSLQGVAGSRPTEFRPPSRALFVVDPGTRGDRAEFSALPGAHREVGGITPAYAEARILTGAAATRTTIVEEIGGAQVFHFAGHAIFNDRIPERSFLVIDPQEARGGGGRLTAEQLGALDLAHVRLVVLSACETMRSHDGRSGGFAGFSAALLRAGTRGVVGSMWRVDDAATAHLMVEFHRAYVASGDGPGALRSAQLRLLGSDDPLFRSPSAWAGFRYAGN